MALDPKTTYIVKESGVFSAKKEKAPSSEYGLKGIAYGHADVIDLRDLMYRGTTVQIGAASIVSSPPRGGGRNPWHEMQVSQQDHSLAQELRELKEEIRELRHAIREMTVHQPMQIRDVSPDQAITEVAELLRSSSIEMYPSDIARELSLDYEVVIAALSALREQGKVEFPSN